MKAEDILKALPVNYYVVDLKRKKVVQTNDPKINTGDDPCFMQLFHEGKPCSEIIGNCLCQQFLENKSAGNFNLEGFKNGTRQYFRVDIKKLHGNLVVATYSNITRETVSANEIKINNRRMERAEIHESLTDLNLAQQIARIGNWKYDPETGKLKWSDQVLSILNQRNIPLTPVIDDFKYFTGEEYFKLFKNAILSAVNEGKPFEHQFQITGKDKTEKWVEIICKPDKEKGNSGYFLRGTVQDITSSKKVENELSKTNILLDTLIQNLPDAIYMKDTGYRKVISNKSDLVNCGDKKLEEVIGLTDFDIYPKEIAEKYFEDDKQVIEHGQIIFNREEELPGDPKRWILTTKVPLRNNDGQITGLVGIGHDITRRKQLMEELNEAIQKAKESDWLKSLFLANMSHEIRTPLNAILGFSSIITSGKLSQEKMNYYGDIIEKSGQRLTTVINDIIDISLIQANQLKIDFTVFNINDLFDEISAIFKNQKEKKLEKIDFSINYCASPDCKFINSDRNRLFQILRNLLDNAFKFTEKGHIRFGCYDYTNEAIIFYVEDSGIGIDEKKTPVIFESFRQAHEGFSRNYEGTGLGLSIVSGIVERLEGKVWFESKTGKGSTFYLSIPRKMEKKFNIPEKEDQQPKLPDKQVMKKKIVSFEDDPASIEYLKSVANNLGCDIVNFDHPPSGIEYLRKNKTDLVLMDVRLPVMNGFEATGIIKSEFPNLPVIIQTAYAMKGDMEKALQSGCDDYLSKPIPLKVLKEKIVWYITQEIWS